MKNENYILLKGKFLVYKEETPKTDHDVTLFMPYHVFYIKKNINLNQFQKNFDETLLLDTIKFLGVTGVYCCFWNSDKTITDSVRNFLSKEFQFPELYGYSINSMISNKLPDTISKSRDVKMLALFEGEIKCLPNLYPCDHQFYSLNSIVNSPSKTYLHVPFQSNFLEFKRKIK